MRALSGGRGSRGGSPRLVSRRVGAQTQKVGPEGWGPSRVGVPEGWGPKHRKSGARRVGALTGGGRRVGARRMGAQKGGGPKPKISRFFFFLLPPPIFIPFFSLWGSSRLFFFSSPGVFSCLFSSWGSSRGILVVFWSVGTSKCGCFRPQGCLVEAPGGPKIEKKWEKYLPSQIKKSTNQKIAKHAKRRKIKSKYCSNKKK